MSDAFRAIDRRRLSGWDWTSTSILYVSHDWDPVHDGAQAITGHRLVNALLHVGARVHVLAATGASAPRLDAGDRYRVTVVPCRPFPASKTGRALQMIRSTVPEAAGQWISAAFAAGLQIAGTLPAESLIYGRAAPGSSNIVAWRLARATQRPWVAHFSDEWPSVQVLADGRKWSAPYKWPLFEWWRRRIISDSGALTFSNPGLGEEVLGRSRASHRRKAFVVAHLASQLTPRNLPPRYDMFHIVHTGNFYRGQTTAAVMKGLRLFLDRTPAAGGLVRVTQAGWSNGDMPEWTERCGLTGIVRFTGRLGQNDVLALIDDASLLLAVDYARPSSRTVLSKLPDYLNARRPILTVTAPSTSLGRMCREDGLGRQAHYDAPEEIAKEIGLVFDAWRARRLESMLPQPAVLDAYDWRQVLAELAAAFATARDRAAAPQVSR